MEAIEMIKTLMAKLEAKQIAVGSEYDKHRVKYLASGVLGEQGAQVLGEYMGINSALVICRDMLDELKREARREQF